MCLSVYNDCWTVSSDFINKLICGRMSETHPEHWHFRTVTASHHWVPQSHFLLMKVTYSWTPCHINFAVTFLLSIKDHIHIPTESPATKSMWHLRLITWNKQPSLWYAHRGRSLLDIWGESLLRLFNMKSMIFKSENTLITGKP